MKINIPFLIILAVIAGFLFGISRVRNQNVHERGHLALSIIPWLHLFISYIFAFYIRLGFGSWPQCCTDNPDLPMIHVFVVGLDLGFLIILIAIPLWLGWLIVHLLKKMKRFWLPAAILFTTGIALMVAAQVIDPWGFWGWFWD